MLLKAEEFHLILHSIPLNSPLNSRSLRLNIISVMLHSKRLFSISDTSLCYTSWFVLQKKIDKKAFFSSLKEKKVAWAHHCQTEGHWLLALLIHQMKDQNLDFPVSHRKPLIFPRNNGKSVQNLHLAAFYIVEASLFSLKAYLEDSKCFYEVDSITSLSKWWYQKLAIFMFRTENHTIFPRNNEKSTELSFGCFLCSRSLTSFIQDIVHIKSL